MSDIFWKLQDIYLHFLLFLILIESTNSLSDNLHDAQFKKKEKTKILKPFLNMQICFQINMCLDLFGFVVVMVTCSEISAVTLVSVMFL